jgi:hypothetical protein
MTVMPEQQKVDETIESTSLRRDKKIPKKIENASTALEEEEEEKENSTVETDMDNGDSVLESDADDLKEI